MHDNIIQFTNFPSLQSMIENHTDITIQIKHLDRLYPNTLQGVLDMLKLEYSDCITMKLTKILNEGIKEDIIQKKSELYLENKSGNLSGILLFFALGFIHEKLNEPERSIFFFCDALWLLKSGETELLTTQELNLNPDKAQKFAVGMMISKIDLAGKAISAARDTILKRH